MTARISFSWRLSTIAFLHARFATLKIVPKGPPAPKIGNPPSSPAQVAARKSSQRTAETSGFLPGDLFGRSARRSQPRVSGRCPIFPHPQRHWSGQIWTRQSRLEGDEPKNGPPSFASRSAAAVRANGWQHRKAPCRGIPSGGAFAFRLKASVGAAWDLPESLCSVERCPPNPAGEPGSHNWFERARVPRAAVSASDTSVIRHPPHAALRMYAGGIELSRGTPKTAMPKARAPRCKCIARAQVRPV